MIQHLFCDIFSLSLGGLCCAGKGVINDLGGWEGW